MEADYDVVIIGGGMVGASLACALAPLGLRIGVIEAVPLSASTQPSYDDRTVALAFGSRRIFEGIGVWNEIARPGGGSRHPASRDTDTSLWGVTPIERIHISDRGHFGCTRLTAADLGREALGYVVENRVLGAALLKHLHATPDIAWLCPARLEHLELEGALATVTIRHDDQLRTLRARLVVGADGADSVVRAAAGLEASRTEYGQTAIVTNVMPETPHANTAFERFTNTGPLAVLPMTLGRCAVVWSARAEEVDTILGWSDNEYLERLQERFGDRLGRLTRPGKRAAYPLKLTRVPEQARARLVVIGNAAHTVHPVAGQGFNLGLRDVAVLAEVLATAVRRQEDIGDRAVLQSYTARRVHDNRVTQAFTHSLIRVFANDFPPLVLARNLGLVAVDLLPPVKRAFVRVTSGFAGTLPRLARGLPL